MERLSRSHKFSNTNILSRMRTGQLRVIFTDRAQRRSLIGTAHEVQDFAVICTPPMALFLDTVGTGQQLSQHVIQFADGLRLHASSVAIRSSTSLRRRSEKCCCMMALD